MTTTKLLGTKFAKPAITAGAVLSSSVDAIYRAVQDGNKAVIVVAPTGYGKSTALAQAMEQLQAAQIACSWLSLDPEDNDQHRFLLYLIGAIQNILSSVGANAVAQIGSGCRLSLDALLSSLAKDLEQIPQPFVCFLDDYHFITSPAVHNVMSWLVTYTRENIVFVIASREDVGFPVNALKMRRRLARVSAEELSFNIREVGDFLNRYRGLDLGGRYVRALADRTEGWVAGLQFASLILEKGGDPDQLIEKFTGGDRDVTDFLAETVLARQTDEVRRFLLWTSVLDRMNAALCEAVTGNAGSQALLEEIEGKGLFLIPLDRDRCWYRYHHLFGEFLKGRFLASHRAEIARVYRMAADWAKENGYAYDAIRYALAAKDYAEAAKLISGCALNLLQNEGAHATLLGWVRQLPAAQLDQWPRIRLDYAWSLAFSRKFDEAAVQLRLVENSFGKRKNEQTRKEAGPIEINLKMMRCVVTGGWDDTSQSRALAAEWLRENRGAEPSWAAAVNCVLAHSTLSTFEYDLGQSACSNGRQLARQCGAHYPVAWTYALSGIISMEQAERQLATESYQEGLTQSNRIMGPCSYTSLILSALLAEALYEQDRIDDARGLLADSFSLVAEEGIVEVAWAGYSVMAKLQAMEGNPEGAMRTLGLAEESAAASSLHRLGALSVGAQVRLHLRQGRVDRAYELADARGFLTREADMFATDTRTVMQEIRTLVLAELHCERGAVQSAIPSINGLIEEARRHGRRRRLMELLILRSRALWLQKGKSEALRSLGEALKIAAAGGFVRTLADQGAEVREMLLGIAGSRVGIPEGLEDFVNTVNIVAGKSVNRERNGKPCGAQRAAAQLVEPMTKRELRILDLLSEGSSNREIADKVFVSEQTVKWHLHNIFGKLGVGNRTRAVAVARDLKLVSKGGDSVVNAT